MRSLLFLSAFLLAATLSSTTDTNGSPLGNGPLVGGWRPIDNLSDPQVQEIARYAVAEHNRNTNSVLKLTHVLSGETQVVSGIKYRLIFNAANGGLVAKYKAVVLDQPSNHYELISFDQVK